MHEHTEPPTLPSAPPLILIIPAARVDTLPEPVAAIVRRCESAYSRGKWFVTVPAELWCQWPQEEPVL